tara:strand:+ start:193 stop:507 length:315 start_codon:yes stop_codon:yes gene_type:complete
MRTSGEVNNLFLKGGKVVHSETHTLKTYLIRMPKEEFIKDISETWGTRYFEYVLVENLLKPNELIIAKYLNNSLSGARKIAVKDHEERCYYVYSKERNLTNKGV